MSVTAPAGFRASGVSCGIKADGALDLALLVADAPVAAAAVFTTSRAAAAPVVVSKRHLAASGTISVVVANAGCANAGTGAPGEMDALAMARVAADAVDKPVEEVLVASTGPIGPRLPMSAVASGVAVAARELETTGDAATAAARAIMTTDTVTKEVAIDGGGFKVGGMAKGSGMIRPDMATMLCFLTTDAVVPRDALDGALRFAVDESFHSLTIDGCGSTNDTVAVLASGASGVEPEAGALTAALTAACVALSRRMAEDAEGARRVVTIEVSGAADDAAARSAGRAIADSALVSASFYGGDPNWGRLLGALGASGLPFEPERFGVAYQGIPVAAGGVQVDYDVERLLGLLESGDLEVSVNIGAGPGRARILTTDLTPEYVVFNGERS